MYLIFISGIMDVLSTVFGQADDPQNSANITLYNSANKSLCSNIESSKAKNDDTDFEHFPLLSTIYNIGSELTRTNFIDSEQKNLSEFGKCDKGAEGQQKLFISINNFSFHRYM